MLGLKLSDDSDETYVKSLASSQRVHIYYQNGFRSLNNHRHGPLAASFIVIMHIYIYIYMYVCMYVCMYVYVCKVNIHTYIYIYIYM